MRRLGSPLPAEAFRSHLGRRLSRRRPDAGSTFLALDRLDEVEGFHPGEPDASLYTRVETNVTFEDGRVDTAWAYFYNAPLGQAPRIESGDYLEYLKLKK